MGDPNFPINLAIQPSHPATVQSPSATLHFDQKSGIKTYGIAGRVWEAAYVLAAYTTPPTEGKIDSASNSNDDGIEFDPRCSLFRADTNLTVVEIGSGTGYAGMHLAQQISLFRSRGAHPGPPASDAVILTDLSNVIPLLDKGLHEHLESFGQVKVQAQALAWGDADHVAALARRLSDSGSSITHVLCSDLVYFPFLYPPLLRTLLTLTSPPFCCDRSPEIIIGYKTRSLAKESPFWQVFGTWFTFQVVLARQKRSGDDGEDSWIRFGQTNDTLIFVAVRRPESLGWVVPMLDGQLMSGYGPTPPALDDTFESLLMLGIADDV
ncbi:putative methyltransferase [Rhizoctonia solani 123E]|uniref:Putative methyltransferase n=1 Tax=Rhizoctonia solani 123E TaxID=1423351 RepID=A0A074RXD6_9AGAM|nr:putative methyltransferase [Rhizoctonia solani 123E]